METGQRVLVVDDETSIRRYLRAALSAQGFTVYEAVNGQEALERCRCQPSRHHYP